MAELATIGLVEKKLDGHGLCVNSASIRGFTECNGACSSGTKYNKINFTQEKRCDCCSVESYDTIKVPVKCTDGHKDDISISVPKTCSCRPCDGDSNDTINDIFKV